MSKIVEIKSVDDIDTPSIQDAETIIISNSSKLLDEMRINERHKYFSGLCRNDVEIVENFLYSIDSIYKREVGRFFEEFTDFYRNIQEEANVIIPVSADDNDSIFLAELYLAGKKLFDKKEQRESISTPVAVGRNNKNEVIWAVDSLQDDNKLFCSLGSQYDYNGILEKFYNEYGLNNESPKCMQKDSEIIEEPPPFIKEVFNSDKYSDIFLRKSLEDKLKNNSQLITMAMSQVENNLKTLKYCKDGNNLKKIIEYAPEFYIKFWNLIYYSNSLLQITGENKNIDKETTLYIKAFLKDFILSKKLTKDTLKTACDELAKKIMTYRMIDKSMFSNYNIVISYLDFQNISYCMDYNDLPVFITIDSLSGGETTICHPDRKSHHIEKIKLNFSLYDKSIFVKRWKTNKKRHTDAPPEREGSSKIINVSSNHEINRPITLLSFIKFSTLYLSCRHPFERLNLQKNHNYWLPNKIFNDAGGFKEPHSFILFSEKNVHTYIERQLKHENCDEVLNIKELYKIKQIGKDLSIKLDANRIKFIVDNSLIDYIKAHKLTLNNEDSRTDIIIKKPMNTMCENFNKNKSEYLKELKKTQRK